MKKTTTTCASCGGKMKAGGTAKKKMMVGGATKTMGSCKDGDPKCKEGNYNKGRGTGPNKGGIFAKIKQSNFKKAKLKG